MFPHSPRSGGSCIKPVVQIFNNQTNELVHVTVNGETITCTNEHPFYSPVKGWIAACQLRAGDILVMLNGERIVVEQVQHELLESPVAIYNFEVEGFHTYYVGDTEVLVHNTCTKNNYRKKALEYYGIDGTGLDAHHVYPQANEFREFFAEAGTNPHSPWNIEMMEHALHMKEAVAYNRKWRQLIKENPNTSRRALLHAAGFIMDDIYKR